MRNNRSRAMPGMSICPGAEWRSGGCEGPPFFCVGTAMILGLGKPNQPGAIYVMATLAGFFDYAMPEWISVLLDDPFEGLAHVQALRTAATGPDQPRVVSCQATLCFHCAMTSPSRH